MKRGLGLLLFYLSWLLWGLVFVVPFMLDMQLESLALLTTSLIVAAEVCFWISLLLLGQAFYIVIKARLKSCWRYCRGGKKVE